MPESAASHPSRSGLPLDVDVYRRDRAVHLVLKGRMILETADELREAGEKLLDDEIGELGLNLELVDYIDSSGLGALVALRARCAAEDIRLRLLAPSPQVEEIFRFARLDKIFEMCTAEDSAQIRARMETAEHAVPYQTRARRHATMAIEEPAPAAVSAAAHSDGRDDESKSLVNAYCREAMEKVQRGEFQRAVEIYQQALSVEPDYLPALNNLAITLEKKSIWTDRAIEVWDKVLAISQSRGDAKHRERAERRLAKLRQKQSERG